MGKTKSTTTNTAGPENTLPTVVKLRAKLTGIRPILFDRYPGDNKTKLKTMEKFYLRPNGQIILPMLNIYSALTAINNDSVANRFYKKEAKDMALGVKAFCLIAGEDSEMDSPIHDSEGKPWTVTDKRISSLFTVGRLKKGQLTIPNPTTRPMLPTGWWCIVNFSLEENNFVNEHTLMRMVEYSGILGACGFRPIFGRYAVEWLDAAA